MKRLLVDDCFRPGQPKLKHDEALAILKRAVASRPAHRLVDLSDAAGRILSHGVTSANPVPAHTNAAVDGFAFLSNPHLREHGGNLPVIGRAAAGQPLTQPAVLAAATRIFTGAVLPDGLDTVVMQEDVQTSPPGDAPAIAVPQGVKSGANVRKAGEDVAAGTTLFGAGHILRPQDLAALASIGRSQVACFDQIRVAIVSTGDEVIDAGAATLALGQVYDANTPMLCALSALTGANVEPLGIWPDDRTEITSKLQQAARVYDVILTSGGASMGEEDHMAHALDELGNRHLWQIAIKPGRPMMFGQIHSGDHDAIVVGLPGNPVAVFVCFLMYVYPLLRAAGGGAWIEPRRFMLPAAFGFADRKKGRREFWRGRLSQTQSGMAVEKFERDGSGLISGLRWSDGLIDIAEDADDISKGDLIAFIPFTEFGIV